MAQQLPQRTALVIDDDPGVSLYIRLDLQRDSSAQWRVEHCTNGNYLNDILDRGGKFDIVLIDRVLGVGFDQQGMTVAEILHNRGMPVVMVCGGVEGRVRRQAGRLGIPIYNSYERLDDTSLDSPFYLRVAREALNFYANIADDHERASGTLPHKESEV